MTMTEECGIVIRITGSESQHDGPDPDCNAEIATAYSFEVVKGTVEQAMAVLETVQEACWLDDVAPSNDGWMIVFSLPDGYEIAVGMEFDIAVGPRAQHLQPT
ncbi:hypothetical protein [Burkholderia pyrrocinia]